MLRTIIALLIIVPALEIWIMIGIGQKIGGLNTLILLFLTALAGALLVQKEARKVWHYARNQLRNGEPPGLSILDGICLFIGGILLITPGFLTDLVGLLFVLPFTRRHFRAGLLKGLKKYAEKNQWFIFYH